MRAKHSVLFIGLLLFAALTMMSFRGQDSLRQQTMDHNKMMAQKSDARIPLNLPPHMKAHQLANMRSHLKSVKDIIGLIGQNRFEQASEIAHAKLGLTEEMKKMCNMSDNENFTQLGLAFHKSADKMGDILLTKDVNKSLQALQTTLTYCVQCHATFRQ